MSSPNSTCRLLSNGYKFDLYNNSKLEYRPCCFFPTWQKVDAPTEDHVQYRAMLNAIDANTDIRCQACNFLTRNKLRKTWQQNSFDIVPDDANLGDASYLELQIDRTCNGGCIICGPWYSSFWANELKQIPIKPIQDPLDNILNLIDIQQTRKINFLGGEPFLSDVDSKVLPLIKNPELVNLQYTTNGSIYPTQEKIRQWSQFKSVLINFSIDGINDRFEYIRYPLKWDTVNKNIQRATQEMPANVEFKVNHTVNIFNLYYVDEFELWYSDLKQSGRYFDFSFNPVNSVLQANSIPIKLLKLLETKYDSDSKVIKLAMSGPINNNTDELFKYINQLDTRRGLNWRKVFPEITECF
jgi:organic radical activating enzyme